MVVILKSNAEKQQVTALLKAVESLGLKTNYSEGQETTVVGLVGDTSRVDIDALKANEIVEDVKRISEPYKKANRRFHPDRQHKNRRRFFPCDCRAVLN